MSITSEQIRAGRALARWEQKQLAEASGISLPTIKRLETTKGELLGIRESTVAAIQRALETQGVVFLADGETSTGGLGVRLQKDRI